MTSTFQHLIQNNPPRYHSFIFKLHLSSVSENCLANNLIATSGPLDKTVGVVNQKLFTVINSAEQLQSTSLLGKRAHSGTSARKATAESEGAANNSSSTGDEAAKDAKNTAKKAAEKSKTKGCKRQKRDQDGEDQDSADENNEQMSSFDSNEDDDDSDNDAAATNHQLFKIERKIQQGGEQLSKRERRLLQNRKSALKCRLKKQQELDKMKKMVERLASENMELKEKVSPSADSLWQYYLQNRRDRYIGF